MKKTRERVGRGGGAPPTKSRASKYTLHYCPMIDDCNSATVLSTSNDIIVKCTCRFISSAAVHLVEHNNKIPVCALAARHPADVGEKQ